MWTFSKESRREEIIDTKYKNGKYNKEINH